MTKLPLKIAWQSSCLLIASTVILPIAALIWLGFFDNQAQVDSIWQHLKNTVLLDYVLNSLYLLIGVGLIAITLGVGSAWLVSHYQFIGKSVVQWALLLPLAIPSYILAYSYTGLLDAPGLVQTWLRNSFDLQYGEYWFPSIRSLGGAIFVMGFVLYPYVYLLARASFIEQSINYKRTSQLLGYSQSKIFYKISLPIARPAIIAGFSLVAMETLADFGTVSYFGVDTFTTGIIRTWFGLDSINGAAQLALILLTFIFIMLILERYSRKKKRYYSGVKTHDFAKRLSPAKSLCALLVACTPICIGFIIPASQLIYWAVLKHSQLFSAEFWQLVQHSFSLGAIAAGIIVLLGILLTYGNRILNTPLIRGVQHIASSGYAIPGVVIAVGISLPIVTIDKHINQWALQYFSYRSGLLISGSVMILLLAYTSRFLSVSIRSMHAGLSAIPNNTDKAAQSLGSSAMRMLRTIHVPLLRTSILTALLIVFVDVIKELPATLVLRPFNYNTLAVKAYELASDERLADAALPSIGIVLVGILPIVLLSKAINRA